MAAPGIILYAYARNNPASINISAKIPAKIICIFNVFTKILLIYAGIDSIARTRISPDICMLRIIPIAINAKIL